MTFEEFKVEVLRRWPGAVFSGTESSHRATCGRLIITHGASGVFYVGDGLHSGGAGWTLKEAMGQAGKWLEHDRKRIEAAQAELMSAIGWGGVC